MNRELVLIDLSSIAYPIWHVSQSEPDPNHASTQIVARVRALANGAPHVAICCDCGRSFRKDLAESYKANRPTQDGTLKHQIDLALDALSEDGFPCWFVAGFEADDVIASGVTRALALDETTTVVMVTADKDLLQLVGPRVKAKSVRDGAFIDADGVVAKFGVKPEQILDFLCLVGDASDNVKGAKGIGDKKAADLLAKFGSLQALYDGLKASGPVSLGLTPALATSIREFGEVREATRALLALRTDVELPFDQILAARQIKQAPMAAPVEERGSDLALMPRPAEVLPAPPEWERQLDPRSMREAQLLAEDMQKSRMFSAYGTPQAVLSTVMIGRELGLPAMASLRSIHVIEGKHTLSASLMVALVLKSGLAEFFDPAEISDTSVTYETKRKGARGPIRLTHSIDMARQAWPKTKPDWEKAFLASGWGKFPTDMLVARASARLARLIYPDLLAGLYTPEELIEARQESAVA